MVTEIQPHDIRVMLCNITATSLANAQKRWRHTYLAISFSNTLASIVKDKRPKKLTTYPDPEIITSPSYSTVEIIQRPERISEHLSDHAAERSFCGINPAELTDTVKNRDLGVLRKLNGVKGLAKALETNLENGINCEDVNRRRTVFGSNTYQKPPPKGFVYFVVEAFKDTTILMLLACAVLSLRFGIKELGAEEGWYEGVSIFLVVFLLIVVSANINFRHERRLDSLLKASNNIKVDVVREGRRQKITIFDIVVGDVVVLNIGDQIPADGLFVNGHNMLVDESSMIRQSDRIKVDAVINPFMLSGSKVVDGYGQMVVLSVGMNTAWGEMMSSKTADSKEQTLLQSRLNKLNSLIGKVGLVVAFLVLGVTGMFSTTLKLVFVALPEGLPLAVTLTLAYSVKRMMADQALVRNLSACETMGSATVICINKTGTLTMNQMKVTKFWLGLDCIEQHASDVIAVQLIELLRQGVGFNTTGTVFKSASGSVPEYSGSPTEKAILYWAITDLDIDMEKLKKGSTVLHVETFNSEKKRSGVSIKKEADNTIDVHWKGAAQIILEMCSNYYQSNGCVKIIGSDERRQLNNMIEGIAASSLKCIAFAHKQVLVEDGTVLSEEGLTLLGIVGLKDRCRPGAKKAIDTCLSAGVEIKMITGDDVFMAKAIATECGILKAGQELCEGEVVEGVEFRNYTDEERMQKVDNIRVMARSSPFDKLLMVKCLKQKGHVVAVIGDGTNDAPALKEADVGVFMGIQGTEVAKESSDIVILDDGGIASVYIVLKWGRCVHTNIQKVLQFLLTNYVASLVLNIFDVVWTGDDPLTTVQDLWVNLIIDTLGALALATEWPTDELVNKPPAGRVEPLITNIMWRNLIAQSLYQIIMILILQFHGKTIFNVNERVKNTIIFNTFVLCQVCNEFNSRKLEKWNIFKGIHKDRLFLGILGMTIVLQVVMVEFLNNFDDTEKLNGEQWGICIGIAALSWPIGWFVKLIPVPDKPFISYTSAFST